MSHNPKTYKTFTEHECSKFNLMKAWGQQFCFVILIETIWLEQKKNGQERKFNLQPPENVQAHCFHENCVEIEK